MTSSRIRLGVSLANSLFLSLLFLLAGLLPTSAQDSARFPTYYFQRLTHFRLMPHTAGDVIFLGNSITDGAEWGELFNDRRVKNRGISGDFTAGILYRLEEVTSRRPDKMFLLIGINDLAANISADTVAENIFRIVERIHMTTPETRVFVQSLLPVNDGLGRFPSHVNKIKEIIRVNQLLQERSLQYAFTFIDLYPRFCDSSGKLNRAYTNDGLHLKGEGYSLWRELIYPFVEDVRDHPALIPLPRLIEWGDSFFSLPSCAAIVISDRSLAKQARDLQELLEQMGWRLPISEKQTAGSIEMRLEKTDAPQLKEEAYRILAKADHVLLAANSPHGMFNAVQTLRQLMRDHATIPACAITDWPAFAWRGFMVDVGRNYLSPSLLRQQIEVMSRYKLNIFHLHLTEDIAWRLQIRQYPQLTEPAAMMRDQGQYYSVAELRDLIEYCKERFITLIPEIDMPGHSAAFTRAMKTGMQSDSGISYVKNIIREVLQTYDLPYLHIGADEVKITNPHFLPEMIAYASRFGVKLIGWEPGADFPNGVIRQLWMDDTGKESGDAHTQFIDSRHLYLNHFDPLEAVTTLFFRKIGNKEQGDDRLLGATLCLWPDRRLAGQKEVEIQNPVFPGMVTFSERTWRGGGREGWTATLGGPQASTVAEFSDFESRLSDHQRQYFTHLPFPYLPQSSFVWTLYGPYDNGGELSSSFKPETNHFDTVGLPVITRVVGGTIVLRHWWYPLIRGAIDYPRENTTIYASTRVWSDIEGWTGFWIGFNNLSRSPASDSPPPGAWDNRKSALWLNGYPVPPPVWKHGGQSGNAEIPLVDEGYEYRPPTEIYLKKGWNTIWIKAPVGIFKGRDWQNPVKWMFTCIPLSRNVGPDAEAN